MTAVSGACREIVDNRYQCPNASVCSRWSASSRRVPAVASAQVSGIVRDTANKPVAGAIVTVQASTIETKTDASGAYSLPNASGKDVNIVAAMPGHYYGFVTVTAPATNADIQIEPVPTTVDPTYEIKSPEMCSACHDEAFTAWKDSPMGKAGTNTWVYDVYDGSATPGGKGGFVYTRDSILSKKNPASECASCHQPETWWNKPYSPLDPVGSKTDAIEHGVSCEVCHKIAKIDAKKPNFPGLWPGVVELAKPGGTPFKQVMFGVLGDVTYGIDNTMKAAYQPQLKADVCAACHQDKNDPDEDGDFEEDNGVISEPTYIEWRDSPYSDPANPKHATCVDCHMKPTNSAQACSHAVPAAQAAGGRRAFARFPGHHPRVSRERREHDDEGHPVGGQYRGRRRDRERQDRPPCADRRDHPQHDLGGGGVPQARRQEAGAHRQASDPRPGRRGRPREGLLRGPAGQAVRQGER
jgi:hypothetical protein